MIWRAENNQRPDLIRAFFTVGMFGEPQPPRISGPSPVEPGSPPADARPPSLRGVLERSKVFGPIAQHLLDACNHIRLAAVPLSRKQFCNASDFAARSSSFGFHRFGSFLIKGGPAHVGVDRFLQL
jgi:hypothetical protein